MTADREFTYHTKPTTWMALSLDTQAVLAESPPGTQYRIFLKQCKVAGYGSRDFILSFREDVSKHYPHALEVWDARAD